MQRDGDGRANGNIQLAANAPVAGHVGIPLDIYLLGADGKHSAARLVFDDDISRRATVVNRYSG